MSDDGSSAGTSLPLSVARRVDQLCDRLEAGYEGGEPVAIEALLEGLVEPERSAGLLPLVELEIELRQRRGECPSAEEYLQRFASHKGIVEQAFRVGQPTPAPTPRTTPQSSGRPGTRLPRLPNYHLLEELGRGGMGVVYLARQRGLDRLVAVKMIRAGGLAGEADRQRFLEEARVIGQLRHPGIIPIHEVGESDGQLYFSQEYARGGSLAGRLDGTPLAPRLAARLVEQLATAVHAAHEQGVLHRDLKPANVLLAWDGSAAGVPDRLDEYVPRVGDFGLARRLADSPRQTPAGAVVGTPSYMAPEQAGAGELGRGADVYSLGAVLYELLTGRPPFRGATVLETLEQVRTQEPVPPRRLQPGCPRDLETIALKCLEKEPARRYLEAGALADDLRRYLDGRPVSARPLGWPGRAARWGRRNPLAAALVIGLALVFLTGFASTLWQLRVAQGNLAEARRQQERYETAYRQARAAVDVLAQVSSRELADLPQTRAVRRKLLEAALGYYQEFLGERGDDSGLRADLVLTQFRLAELAAALGERGKAVGLYRAGLDLQQQLNDDPKQRRHVAGACTNLANLLGGDPVSRQEALHLHQAALREWEAVHEAAGGEAGVRRELAKARVNVAAMHVEGKRWAEALRLLDGTRQLVEGWAADAPADRDWPLLLMRCDRLLAESLDGDGHRGAAVARHQRGVQQGEGLLRTSPDDPAIARELAASYNDLAIAQRRASLPAAARQSYDRAVALLRQLVRRDPEDVGLAGELSRTVFNLAILCQVDRDWPGAAALFGEAAGLLRQQLARTPNDEGLRRRLGERLSRLAAVQREHGQIDAAVRTLQERQALWPRNGAELFRCACELAACVPAAQARQADLGEQVTAAVVDALRAAIDNGFRDGKRFREEPRLAPVRGSPAMQRLLTDPRLAPGG